jgi:hypothetical protein
MKRASLTVLAAVVLVSVAYADDVWKAKPYQQWDAKDVQKILNESPWVRTVHVTAAWRKPGDNNIPLDPGGSSPGNYGTQGASTASGSGAGAGSTSAPSAYGMPGPGAPSNANSGSMAQNQAIMNSAKTPEATFMVRWFSALAVRQALARAQVLGGAMTAADADKALTDAPAEYAIVIAGQDMSPFAKADQKDLAAKASVQPKNGEKMAASHVAIQRVPGAKPEDPRSIAAVVFYFPKKTSAGEPLFSPNTKSVEFVCPVAGAAIKASFDLPKMSGANGRDW